MTGEEQSQQWQQASQPIFAHIAHWRQEHPHATMAEIEQAVDEQMGVPTFLPPIFPAKDL